MRRGSDVAEDLELAAGLMAGPSSKGSLESGNPESAAGASGSADWAICAPFCAAASPSPVSTNSCDQARYPPAAAASASAAPASFSLIPLRRFEVERPQSAGVTAAALSLSPFFSSSIFFSASFSAPIEADGAAGELAFAPEMNRDAAAGVAAIGAEAAAEAENEVRKAGFSIAGAGFFNSFSPAGAFSPPAVGPSGTAD